MLKNIKNNQILDIGCGDGGTSLEFANLGANVTAIDIRSDLIEKFKNTTIKFRSVSIDDISFDDKEFDIVILQDVLEHVFDPNATIKKIRTLLSKTGLIYISTPNRFSLLNLFCDPHWNLPFIALFSRRWVRLFVKDIFRRDRRKRKDWAGLLSLFKLKKIVNSNQLEIKFVNSYAAKYLFQKPESIVCKPFHIKLIYWMKRSGLELFIEKL